MNLRLLCGAMGVIMMPFTNMWQTWGRMDF